MGSPDGGGWWMEKCGWQNAEWKIAIDTMQMTKSLWGKNNFRCFLKVLFVNKPSHLIELRAGEVQYSIFNHKTKKTDKPWSNNNRLDLYRPTPPSVTTWKKDFRCLLLCKFPTQKSGIVKLSEAPLQLSNRAFFSVFTCWPHLNTRRVGRIWDSYTNKRRCQGFA